jgi:3-hydroxymyristoyl/3-hydroxydecanoyl-(acyl carrier protein) dehydratase
MKFRMVDRITAWEPWRRIRGLKAVSFEEYRLKSAFGEPPSLPECLLLESLFQLGNWLVMLSSDFTEMGIVIRTGRVAFPGRLGPGESLVMDVVVRARRAEGILFDGEGRAGGRPVVAGKGCLAVPGPLDRYADPDDLRTLSSEILR